MSWTLNIDKAESLNDSAFRNLLVGTHDYKITSAGMAANKNDPTGRELQVVFRLEHDGISYPVFLQVMAQNDTVAQIATKTVKSFADACGLKGILSADRLKTFVGRTVSVTTKERSYTDGQGNPAKGVNIQTVGPVTSTTVVETPPPAPAAPTPPSTPPPAADEPSMDTPAEQAAASPQPGKKPWE